jgi:predicted DNA-binding transcriptional regulator AlpA
MTRIDLLTPRQLAEQFKCSLATLKRWRRRGEGPPWFHFGVGIRYVEADVEAWVQESSSQLSRALNHPTGPSD